MTIIDPIRPYLRAIEAVAVALLIAGFAIGFLYYGHTRYEQGRADDHKGWDADRAQWQAALDRQKAEASGLLAAAYAQNDALRRANQALHDQQEKDYANHRAETDALHAQLSHVRLRFDAGTPAAGRGKGGAGAVPRTTAKADFAAGSGAELSAATSDALWGIVYDADKLRDAYARCVAAVSGGPAL